MKIYKYIALIMLLFPSMSWAHIGHIENNSFFSGFIHPLTGFDHLFTLLVLGGILLRYQSKKSHLLAILFLSGMSFGFVFSTVIGPLMLIEEIIGLSVAILGLIFLFRGNLHDSVMFALIVLFSSAHGYAHGLEVSGSAVQVLAGILASSSFLIPI